MMFSCHQPFIFLTFLGSSELVTYPGHDAGLFSTIAEAYNKHYNLRTGPEDWWYTIIQTVSLSIQENFINDEVKKFFVDHECKKTLSIKVGSSVCGMDYSWFFTQMVKEIAGNINCPEYISKMESNFSTSTRAHRLAAKMVMMKTVREFYEYKASFMCGIPAIEMKGMEEDWRKLIVKFQALREFLEPIQEDIGLEDSWWDRVEDIVTKLLDTYKGHPDIGKNLMQFDNLIEEI